MVGWLAGTDMVRCLTRTSMVEWLAGASMVGWLAGTDLVCHYRSKQKNYKLSGRKPKPTYKKTSTILERRKQTEIHQHKKQPSKAVLKASLYQTALTKDYQTSHQTNKHS